MYFLVVYLCIMFNCVCSLFWVKRVGLIYTTNEGPVGRLRLSQVADEPVLGRRDLTKQSHGQAYIKGQKS